MANRGCHLLLIFSWMFIFSRTSAAVTAPGSETNASRTAGEPWSCPRVTQPYGISCQCDLPHTLRCAGMASGGSADLSRIISSLRTLPSNNSISLLDLSIQNISRVNEDLFQEVGLQGLVISSGEVQTVPKRAFLGLDLSLTALGLPNNRLTAVPAEALSPLSRLDRLDLSYNKISRLTSQHLSPLQSLTFLDLSDNVIQAIEPGTFASLRSLKSLRLSGNKLEVAQLNNSALKGLEELRELDLSNNQLSGRLPSSFLQGLDSLVDLDLSFNSFSVLKRGMLYGLKNLKTLRLNSNHIGVIEDQAFSALTSLSTLDLNHNGVVAVSGQSLSHLSTLLRLDLSHNYLRAVTMDLVAGLSNLQSLDLTDNDISLVQPEVFAALPKLRHLSLADNPLTCDCQLISLANWLQNTTSLSDEDKKSATCATPPLLENGLLLETDISLLTCENGDPSSDSQEGFLSSTPAEDFIRLSSAQVQFLSAQMDDLTLHTQWTIKDVTLPYTCDAIFIYELSEEHETLLQSYAVTCDSENGRPDKNIELSIHLHEPLKPDKEYRFCLVLFEGNPNEEPSLLPGCSHPLLVSAITEAQPTEAGDNPERQTQITAFYANITAPNSVSVYMRIPDAAHSCRFTVAVFQNQRLLATQILNCSVMAYTFTQLDPTRSAPSSDEYEVCATFSTQGQFLPPPRGEREIDGDIILHGTNMTSSSKAVEYSHCVVAKSLPRMWALENTLVVIAISIVFVLISAALLVATYFLARKIFFQRKKLSNWSSTDPLAIPKTTSRHILYVPEPDYFPDTTTTTPESSEESSTNV